MKIGEMIMITTKSVYYGEKITSYDSNKYSNVQSEIKNRKLPPTDEDINELKQLLDDFKIKVHIPEFNTIAEMDLWRKRQIKKKLGC